MAPIMWVLGLILLFVAGALALGARSQQRRLGRIVSTKSHTAGHLRDLAGSMAEDFGSGSLRFPAGVHGKAACAEPLISELAEVPAVYYAMTVHREYEVTETVRDAQGREQRRRRRGSDQVASNERSVPFLVEDATGSIRVEPSGARFIAEKCLSRFEPAAEPRLRVGRFTLDLPAHAGGSRTLGYRFEEQAIPVGREVYVLGEVRDPGGELTLGGAEEGGEFLVSLKSRPQLIRDLGSGARNLKIAAAVCGVAGLLLLGMGLAAAEPPEATGWVPPPGSLAAVSGEESELRNAVERFGADHRAVLGRFDAEGSPSRRAALRSFYRAWREALDAMDFEALGQEGRVDWLLLERRIASRLHQLEREEMLVAETAPLVPFADAVFALHDALRDAEPVRPRAAAAALAELTRTVDATRQALERGLAGEDDGERLEATPTAAHRAARRLDGLRETLSEWFAFYDGYDPLFTWWAREPHTKADAALGGYADFLRQRIVGEKEGEEPPIVGDPIGREALLEDLALEMIPYAPEELLAIGERELAWCEREMLAASRELGFGDDWHAALEHVKTLHVEPGRQPGLIRDLALEAIAFLEERRLLTLPELAKDVWRIEMISPERQKLNPFFFFNDDAIWVSFPTETMAHDQKLMSLRGNNVHFSRATVHHELIPGHHLQLFMASRYNAHREAFSTPFWIEGWALYWEMVLWDLGFHATPEDRVGALFWRMHRAARIVFSLNFHLGEWTPRQAIDFLVERVGHERDNATAEVRRSFEGSYPPLYQLAYMIGALQFRALAAEVVGPEGLSARDFHDAVLRGGTMPVELVRARLLGQELERGFEPSWRFATHLTPSFSQTAPTPP